MDLALLVPLADVRQDLRLGEGAHALADELVLIGQGEVDHGSSSVADGPSIVGPGPMPWRAAPDPIHSRRMETAPNLTPVLGRYFQREWSHGVGHRLYDTAARRTWTSRTASP